MSFSINFFREIACSEDGNFFISPINVLAAMSIADAAAKGATENELDLVLGLNGTYEQKHRKVSHLLDSLISENLQMANRIWVNQDYTLDDDFSNFISENYHVGVGTIDVSKPDEEAERIDRWTSEHTNEKITTIADPDNINDKLYAVLISAIAYKGSWLRKFDKNSTWNDTWNLGNGSSITVPMMHCGGYLCGYTRDYPDLMFNGISLDLEGDLAMVLIAPADSVTLEQVIALVGEDEINSIIDSHKMGVNIGLVKWKFEGSYELVDSFKNLGVEKAFDESQADFHRMTPFQVYISDIVHKTMIEVNEEGAEMAAATKVEFGLESCCLPPSFNTDRPFIYFAVHKPTRQILFAGRVMDPRQTK